MCVCHSEESVKPRVPHTPQNVTAPNFSRHHQSSLDKCRLTTSYASLSVPVVGWTWIKTATDQYTLFVSHPVLTLTRRRHSPRWRRHNATHHFAKVFLTFSLPYLPRPSKESVSTERSNGGKTFTSLHKCLT